ncbi:hypothetical protein [Mastigocladopsis repens]|uniref:hypothetical protein n=1 Tax=Mastigocladopsis repens TaxID=221287 RepID=UPI0012E9D96C|nr:hypothetical protein [Mastigocladopsis repens]
METKQQRPVRMCAITQNFIGVAELKYETKCSDAVLRLYRILVMQNPFHSWIQQRQMMT